MIDLMEKLGFIGMGNMGSAIASGLIGSGAVKAENVYAYDPYIEQLNSKAAALGFNAVYSASELAEKVDTVLIACKPKDVSAVVTNLGDALCGKALLSIALGWNFRAYSEILPTPVRCQFIMPNTPALVSEGVFLFEEQSSLRPDEREEIKKAFANIGRVYDMPSSLMAIGGVISGCGPAFVDIMIEGFADAAVKYGMPRRLAYELVSQTLIGSATLMLEGDQHPGALKDAVCSPGGSTIRGVEALEKAGFRAACFDAVNAAMEKQ